MFTTPAGRAASRASIYDVAARAGVSHTTVSRVLNGQEGVSAATRARVLGAAEELHFARSSVAVALVTRRSRRIGVLDGAGEQAGPSPLVGALEGAARAQGYAIGAFSLDEAAPEAPSRWDGAGAQGIDALCVISPRAGVVRALEDRGIDVPVVVVSDEVDGAAGVRAIARGQRAAIEAAVDHLVGLGHRVILHLGGPGDDEDARVRERAWRERLRAHRLEVRAPAAGDWSADSGYAFGRGHDLGDATAILVANDQMAAGVLHALAERGIRVPEDLSVVGFGDIPDARHFLPPLTTLRQDLRSLAETTLQALLDAIEGRERPSASRPAPPLTPRLVVRSSTAPVAGDR